MKTNRIATLVLIASFLTLPLCAQTAAELLQKGIYTQETAGDLDGAIALYRQIVNSGNSPRDVAAQAQYRLAQSLLQKGDLPNGAQEFSNLARNYADYGKLISNLATQARADTYVLRRPQTALTLEQERQQSEQERQLAETMQMLNAQRDALARRANSLGTSSEASKQAERAAMLREVEAVLEARAGQLTLPRLETMSFDPKSPVTVKGLVTTVAFVNPRGVISLDAIDGTGKHYEFLTAGTAETAQQGFTSDSLHPGDVVTVSGLLATGGQTLNDVITAKALTITRADGRKIFDSAAVGQARLVDLNKRIQDLEAQLTVLRHTYTENFPDIRIAVAELTDLRKERDQLQAQQPPNGIFVEGQGGSLGGTRVDPGDQVYLWPITMFFDPKSPVTVTRAVVSKVEWSNPFVTILVDPKDGSGKRYTFLLNPPNTLARLGGMTRTSLKPGDEVKITGILASGGGPPTADGSASALRFHLSGPGSSATGYGAAGAQTFPDGTLAALASTIVKGDGSKVYDRTARPTAPGSPQGAGAIKIQ